ncbi:MAG: translocation/assembly module TamB domain-containing protein [Betaproteobacteria bacterium]
MKLLTRLRSHRARRLAGIGLSIAAAILAAAIVSTLTIDLGPGLRALAEREGSLRLKRPIHIGRLSIHLARGRVIVEGLTIDGLEPTDRPFFTAGRLSIGLDWSTLLHREITIQSVEMTDWRMNVEKWEGRHNFPKFGSDEPEQPDKPKLIRTTLRYLHAYRGEFIYDDHEAPWSVVARHLDITITNLPTYHGEATFTGGTVKIQDHPSMWANMRARFRIDKSIIHLDRIDLLTDGASSVAVGDVDIRHWPEQTYQVRSRVHFPRMRELFFEHDTFSLYGDGDFDGVFHLFKGGHDLHGTFASTLAGVNDYRFPALYGSLRWTPHAFTVWDAGSKFFGGDAKFAYSMQPLGQKTRATARFEASYSGVDLAAFSDFRKFPGLRMAGSASGRNLLEWTLGRFAEHRGDGRITVAPPAGAEPMGPALAPDGVDSAADGPGEDDGGRGVSRAEAGAPSGPPPLPAHVPVAGDLTYAYTGDDIEVAPSTFATGSTYVAFQGSTAWGDRSRFTFHVTSRDWQESDEILAAILTDFGSRTGPVAFAGRGEFDGVMTGPFRRPRVEGEFSGDNLRAWDTAWGAGHAHIVVQNSYVDVTGGVVRRAGSEIHADGRFSLGYPRSDGGEEIDARFRVSKRDLASLRHAFKLDDYPLEGLLSGEFHLSGAYQHPIGFGGMTIDDGVAWGEPFETGTASLRFDGKGVRIDGVQLSKAGGSVTGAAFIGWDGTYSFNADGRRIPVEKIASFAYPRAPLTGIAAFSAGGSGTFDQPRYDVRFSVNDLFIAEEGIGQVTATMRLRGKELSGEVEAASPRLAVTGTGRISLTPQSDAEMTFRFHDSSLDPYVRLFVPKLSPFTTAVATGSIRIVGELRNLDHLLIDGTVDSLDLRLFDYALKNAAPIHLALDGHRVTLGELQLVGEDTKLQLSGSVGLQDRRIAMQASGEANLGVLQGFFRNVRGSGHAELTASVTGELSQPVFSGSAVITNGRIRHFSLPNSLDAVNGTINFDARGIRLDDVAATMGGGKVQFGGRIGFDGFMPGDLNVTVRGEDMRLRYPEGVHSVVDADLSVRGNFAAPTLGGTVTVKSATWNRRIDPTASLFDLGGRSSGGEALTGEPAPTVPLRFDLRILVPSSLRIENNLARLVASADLQLRGTYDKPALFGRAEVDRGEVTFEGRRYRVTRGTIDFTNPTRIEPFFDVEAETSVRVPGQTYRVTVRAAGTTDRLQPTLESDPPLPTADVLALLFSDIRRDQQGGLGDVELRALQNPNQRQADILTTRATQLLANPLSSEVGKVVEQTFGVDTFQLTPTLIDPYSLQTTRVNPSARVTIGKRISDRVYLTYSRSLNSVVNDQIILLEYDASDRLSWILSQNEDQTYALEFRVRHTF